MSKPAKFLSRSARRAFVLAALAASGCSVLQDRSDPLLGGHHRAQSDRGAILVRTDLQLPQSAERVIAKAVQDGLVSPERSEPVAWRAGGLSGNVRIGVPFSVNDMRCRDVQIVVISAEGRQTTGDTMCQKTSGTWGSVMVPPSSAGENN